jgi:hemoglobin-like flavoprotein
MHAAYLIQMIDTALNMLAPNIELLTESMHELAMKNERYGIKPEMVFIKPEMFPLLGDGLLHTLETTLKSDFTEPVKEAWVETYKALSFDMIRAQGKAKESCSIKS